MRWTKITEDNLNDLKPGMTIKYHNGYEWSTRILDEFWIDRKYIGTGVHSEIARFINPMFGKYTYYK